MLTGILEANDWLVYGSVGMGLILLTTVNRFMSTSERQSKDTVRISCLVR